MQARNSLQCLDATKSSNLWYLKQWLLQGHEMLPKKLQKQMQMAAKLTSISNWNGFQWKVFTPV